MLLQRLLQQVLLQESRVRILAVRTEVRTEKANFQARSAGLPVAPFPLSPDPYAKGRRRARVKRSTTNGVRG